MSNREGMPSREIVKESPTVFNFLGDELAVSSDAPQEHESSVVNRRTILSGLVSAIGMSVLGGEASSQSTAQKKSEMISTTPQRVAEQAQYERAIKKLQAIPTHPAYREKELRAEVSRPFVAPDPKEGSKGDVSRWPTIPLFRRHGPTEGFHFLGVPFTQDAIMVESYPLMLYSRPAAERLEKDGLNFMLVRHRASPTFSRSPVFTEQQFEKGALAGKSVLITGFRFNAEDKKWSPGVEVGTVVDLAADQDIRTLIERHFFQSRGVTSGDPRAQAMMGKVLKNSFLIRVKEVKVGETAGIKAGGLTTLIDSKSTTPQDAKITGMIYERLLIPTGPQGAPSIEVYLAQKSEVLSHALKQEPIALD